ncbi:hypothetical protein CIB95_08485 [Lottiidibacillus patelloidae]|uniref:Glycosyltransferase subfamily 4-like N-terminal domain-containing protein n=1 Tax=Lottiidibacillus patelloidae TaxID=2670334 RepID=A0A263BUQ0_9BACI|nr:glycosyltransferase family 4 protein [Lottiidibacillus patelloidae]OZM57481.1 hypothetical protein CIB95_08485 [Lottiidibacillus patelloidae]
MKILIVSYFFAPYNTIGAVRVTKMVKYLERLGHEVRVISAIDQPLPANLTVESKEKNVIRTKYFSIAKYFQFLFGGKKSIETKGYQLPSKGWIQKVASLYKTIFHFPDGQIGWYPYALRAGKKLTKRWKPDVIVASGGPFTSFLVAKKLAKYNSIPWVADLRDLWVDNANYNYPTIRKLLESILEKRTLTTASALITISEPLANKLRNKFDSKIEVIMNGYDEEDFPKQTKNSSSRTGKLQIVYTGMVYEGYQDVTPLFEVLAKNKKIADEVEVHFYGRNLEFINNLRNKFGLQDYIKIFDPVSHSKVLEIQAQADILLLLLWNDETEKGIYTGKLYEYIGARRPILAVGNGENVAGDLIRNTNRGFVSNEAGQIFRQLNNWIRDKKKSRIEDLPLLISCNLTRKEQTYQLVSLLEKVLSDSYE